MGRPTAYKPGVRIGNITIMDRAEPSARSRSHSAFWRVRCDCGREHVRESQTLRATDRAAQYARLAEE
jgi:hypothetical protein